MPGLSEIQEHLAPVVEWLRSHAADSGRLRLRTKFLLSLVLVIAALTFSTLLIVGHSAEVAGAEGDRAGHAQFCPYF